MLEHKFDLGLELHAADLLGCFGMDALVCGSACSLSFSGSDKRSSIASPSGSNEHSPTTSSSCEYLTPRGTSAV